MKIGDEVRLISKEKISHEWENWILLSEKENNTEYKIGDKFIIISIDPSGYIRLLGLPYVHAPEKFELIS